MTVDTERSGTRLATLVANVLAVVRVTEPLTDVAALQTVATLTHTPALRR